MKADALYEAIGEIQDDFIREAERKRLPVYKRVWKSLIAACAAVVLIAVPVSAEIRNGYVSNLLAPLYGGSQTELVDSIGVPVGATATVGDYTLSADAVIGDRYNIAVVYTLVRNDNGLLPAGIQFAKYDDSSLLFKGGGGGGYLQQKCSEDGRSLRIVQSATRKVAFSLFFNRNVQVTFENLVLYDKESGEKTLVAEGCWELSFALRYEDTTVELPANDLDVMDSAGERYQIHRILLSPVGVHIDMTAPNLHIDARYESLYPDFTVSLLLADETVIELEDWHIGARGDSEEETFDANFGAMFETPIPLEEITALIICDTVFPLELSE